MPSLDPKSIRLTETVKKGGCAAKLPAGQLRTLLAQLRMHKPESLLVGAETMDDACVWDLGNGQCLVQTLDFFTPIVDDAQDFGAIAASNALSDIYAMGGSPKTALSILAFPAQSLPLELTQPLMQGALDKIHEAGACLAGGHTIDDDTLKFGLSVSGFVAKDKIWNNGGAKAGDALVLTKALGTGTLTTALKLREVKSADIEGAILSMKQLNRAPELLVGERVHAATDITGFGLAGHALQMARASQVSFEIDRESLPWLSGAMEAIENEFLNRAHTTNLEYVKEAVRFDGVADPLKWLMVDPQTSGGLLLAVPAERVATVLRLLEPVFSRTTCIGRVVPQRDSQSVIVLK